MLLRPRHMQRCIGTPGPSIKICTIGGSKAEARLKTHKERQDEWIKSMPQAWGIRDGEAVGAQFPKLLSKGYLNSQACMLHNVESQVKKLSVWARLKENLTGIADKLPLQRRSIGIPGPSTKICTIGGKHIIKNDKANVSNLCLRHEA